MEDTSFRLGPAEIGASEHLTRDEFARLFRISPRTALDWESKGIGPRPSRVSPRVALYDRREAIDFLRSRRVGQ